MTNEKKERLKEIIDSLLNSNMGTTGELNYQEMMWFQETIHSLLDRVPSEEQAKGTQVYISIDSNGKPNRKRTYCGKCGLCVKNQKYCQDCGAKLIWPAVVYNRKALGIKGKG